MKCLFCHHTAENNTFSAIPTTQSCMICHVALRTETELMKPVIISYDKKKPIEWIRIFKLPEYTHFNHSSHINAGMDCASCHGEIEKMETVYRDRDFTMKWCLDCHRQPERYIILPRNISGIFFDDKKYKALTADIINSYSEPETSPQFGSYYTGKLMSEYGIFKSKLSGKGPENCSACHY